MKKTNYKIIALALAFISLISSLFGLIDATELQTFAQTCVQPPANMVAWYPGDGNANDIQGSNHGTLQNGATFASGMVAQAFSFDGVDDEVTVNSFSPGNTVTLDAWLNPSTLTGGFSDAGLPGVTRRTAAGGLSSFADWSIGLYGGKLGALYRPAGGGIAVLQSNIVVQTGNWYHVALTLDGTTARLYVNGALQASGATDSYSVSPDFQIGGAFCSNCTGDNFAGLVDEVEVFNRALSQTEIQSIFNAGSAGKCKPGATPMPTTFTVNTTSDTNDGVCNTTHCSLREAILAANANAGTDTIAFNIPGTGPHTIALTSALPTVTDPVIIDGYTQPGASPNTNATGAINSVLMIELNGSGAGNTDGLNITGGGSTVRGLVINRFSRNGIILQTNGGNRIEGNFIGTNVAGNADLGNALNGILISQSSNNTVGGTTASARNLISGNDNEGIAIIGNGATGNLVQGNYIGTNVTGLSALGNSFVGVNIFTANNTVGGAVEARNVISANGGAGVALQGANAIGNLIQRNFIGVGADGTTPLGNVPATVPGGSGLGWGVLFSNGAASNSATDNLIANNVAEGVLVFANSAINNAILRNAIFANGSLGIDLGLDGVTVNDAGDGDTGPNNLQNYPVITSATSSGSNLTIQGSLNSTANTTFRVEFFSNSACDASGFGEGQNFLGFANVTTDGNGNAAINTTLTGLGATSGFLTATATDPNNNTSEFSQCASITGTCPTITVSPTSLPNAAVGSSYNQTVSATGGASPYSFAVTSGSLPTGLTLNASTGEISGTPTAAGTFNFTVTATDDNDCAGSQAYSITVDCPTITFNQSSLSNGTVGSSYSQTVSASGGTMPYSYAVTSGSLPSGLSLNPNTGEITGTPTSSGTFNFTVTATDDNDCTGSQAYSITVDCPTITVNPSSLPNGTAGSPYNQTVSASGLSGSFTFAVTSGSLPAGLSLNPSTGVISGTPTTTGMFNFTITATHDASNCQGSRSYSIQIDCPVITLSPTSLPNAAVGSSYSQTVSASGGIGSYTYSVTGGSLPSGLSLNSNTGEISGTPDTAGTFSFTITATDANGCQGSRVYNNFTVSGQQYQFSWFYYSDLLLRENVLNQVTAGSDVPIRFTLNGYKGNPYSQPPTSVQISCSTLSPIGTEQVIDRYAPDPYYSSLYDFYQTTWRTKTTWKYTCRRLTLYLTDGSTHSLNFYFK